MGQDQNTIAITTQLVESADRLRPVPLDGPRPEGTHPIWCDRATDCGTWRPLSDGRFDYSRTHQSAPRRIEFANDLEAGEMFGPLEARLWQNEDEEAIDPPLAMIEPFADYWATPETLRRAAAFFQKIAAEVDEARLLFFNEYGQPATEERSTNND